MTRISRALISVSDKAGIAELRACPGGPRHRADIHGRHGRGAARGRPRRHGRQQGHRVSRDHGRPGQDPAPRHPRRAARPARRRRRRDGASTASRRSISLVVNLYPFEATVARSGLHPRGGHREHRHRRAGHDPGCREEPRLRRRGRGSRRLRRHHRRARRPPGGALSEGTRRRLARKAFAHTASYDAAIWSYLNATEGDGDAARATCRSRCASRPTCVTARTRTSARRSTAWPAPWRRHAARGAPAPGQGRCPSTTSPTPMRRSNARGRCRPLPASSSSTPIRAASGLPRRSPAATRRPTPAIPESAFGGVIACNADGRRRAGRDHRRAAVPRGDRGAIVHAPRRCRPSRASRTSACSRPARSPIPRRPSLRLQQVEGGVLVQDKDVAMVAQGRTACRVEAPAFGPRTRRRPLRLARDPLREVERDHLLPRWRHARHRRRPDEPRDERAHRRMEGRRGETRHPRLGDGLRCVLPVPRRHRRGGQPRHLGSDPAWRLDARRRGDPGGGRARHRDDLHRRAAFPALRRR